MALKPFTKQLTLFLFFAVSIFSCTNNDKGYDYSVSENSIQLNDITLHSLPLLSIKTKGDILDEPKSLALLDIQNSLSSSNDNTQQTYTIGIETRGQVSQNFPKKQYGIELWQTDQPALSLLGQKENALGDAKSNIDISLLGLTGGDDYILNAPFTDKSLMRNHLVYQLSHQATTRFQPQAKFVELVLNESDYRGVYLLIDKANKERLNLTGEGYLIEKSPQSKIDLNDEYFKAQNGDLIVVKWPKQKAAIDTIKSEYDAWTSLINTSATVEELSAFVNVDSFIDYFLFNEFFKNDDAYFASTFFYKQDGGLITAGPLWDFNLSSGNSTEDNRRPPQGWLHNNQTVNLWLIQQIDTNIRLKARWKSLRQDILSDENLSQIIQTNHQMLQTAATNNFAKWDILGWDIWGWKDVGYVSESARKSFDEEVDYLSWWLHTRLDWIDKHIDAL